MMTFKKSGTEIAVLASSMVLIATVAHADTTLTIATVNNVQMVEMQNLSSAFQKESSRHSSQLGCLGGEHPEAARDH